MVDSSSIVLVLINLERSLFMSELNDCVSTVNNGLKDLQKTNLTFSYVLYGVGFGLCGASDIAGQHHEFNKTVNKARNEYMDKFFGISDKKSAIKLLNHTKKLLINK